MHAPALVNRSTWLISVCARGSGCVYVHISFLVTHSCSFFGWVTHSGFRQLQSSLPGYTSLPFTAPLCPVVECWAHTYAAPGLCARRKSPNKCLLALIKVNHQYPAQKKRKLIFFTWIIALSKIQWRKCPSQRSETHTAGNRASESCDSHITPKAYSHPNSEWVYCKWLITKLKLSFK